MNGVINHLYNNKKINLDMLEGYKILDTIIKTFTDMFQNH